MYNLLTIVFVVKTELTEVNENAIEIMLGISKDLHSGWYLDGDFIFHTSIMARTKGKLKTNLELTEV